MDASDPASDPASDDARDDDLQARLTALEALLAETELERAHERLRHREYVLGLMLENEALKDKNTLLARRVKRNKQLLLEERRAAKRRERELHEGLEQVYASRTWRVGRAVATPLRGLGRS